MHHQTEICMDRCKNVFVYNLTIHPCRVQWRGAGQAGRGIEEQVSSAAQRTERHFKAMIVVVVDR